MLLLCYILETMRFLIFIIFLPIHHSAPCIMQHKLGMEDGRIEDNQISASSFYGGDRPKYARLNLKSDLRSGQNTGSYGGWCTTDDDKWIQVAFDTPVAMAGVLMQARGRYRQFEHWISEYKVQFGNDSVEWHYVMDIGTQNEMVSICHSAVFKLSRKSTHRLIVILV